MVDYTSLVAAAFGFAPPIALMLWTLQPYTYPRVERPYFSDPTFFGLFAVGIVIGVALYLVSLFINPAYAVIGFLLEEAIKLMILNMPRFQKRADTPFYGFGLGAGMAASLAFGAINFTLTRVGFDALSLVIIALYSIMISFLQISTATTIGMGVARGTPWPFFGQAVVVHLAVVLLLAPFNGVLTDSETLVPLALFGLALVFIGSYYYYTLYKLLPAYVKEALAKLGGGKPKKARKVRKTKD